MGARRRAGRARPSRVQSRSGAPSTRSLVLAAIVQAPLYLAAAWLIIQRPDEVGTARRALVCILLVGVAMRLIVIAAPPVSSDVYRYIWDGRVQAAGINPYRYVPADEALRDLRDDVIYPKINRADYAPTIYPPAAQIVFLAVTRISESVTAMKVAMVAFEAIAVWAMLQMLFKRGTAADAYPSLRLAPSAGLGICRQRTPRYHRDCVSLVWHLLP